MYKQLAERIAGAIADGEHEPGSMLPSESQLMALYGVSRPTVRSAIAELRSMGLVDSQHGLGSFVRTHTEPSAVLDRSLTRKGKRVFVGWTPDRVELPSVTRGQATDFVGTLLERDEEAVFIAEHLIADPITGTRAVLRVFIPFDVAEQVPTLAKRPDADPSKIYAALAAAGHDLMWTEHVTARSALPSERTALAMATSDTAPVLITYRVAATADGQPLVLEELCTSAGQAQLSYRITAEDETARRRD
ncbi:GntR family transcriptional regulator [Streptomyces sp. NPDC021622]|uniref:GntR family transcriptional regulator n=1 Tax=Streptomyces sp. NPDC021622 TaxID=3155013 RepID=UPI0033C0D368